MPPMTDTNTGSYYATTLKPAGRDDALFSDDTGLTHQTSGYPARSTTRLCKPSSPSPPTRPSSTTTTCTARLLKSRQTEHHTDTFITDPETSSVGLFHDQTSSPPLPCSSELLVTDAVATQSSALPVPSFFGSDDLRALAETPREAGGSLPSLSWFWARRLGGCPDIAVISGFRPLGAFGPEDMGCSVAVVVARGVSSLLKPTRSSCTSRTRCDLAFSFVLFERMTDLDSRAQTIPPEGFQSLFRFWV